MALYKARIPLLIILSLVFIFFVASLFAQEKVSLDNVYNKKGTNKKTVYLEGDVKITFKNENMGCSGCTGGATPRVDVNEKDIFIKVEYTCKGLCEAYWPLSIEKVFLKDLKPGKYNVYSEPQIKYEIEKLKSQKLKKGKNKKEI